MSENLPLAERLQRMRALENERLENLTRQQLNDLRSELNGILKRELNTIRSDIYNQLGALSREYQATQKSLLWRLTKGRILYPALTALSVLATIWLSGWGVSTWLEWKIASNWQELHDQSQVIEQQRETLKKMTAKTWEVQYHQDGNRRYLVMPKGATASVIKFQGKDWVEITKE